MGFIFLEHLPVNFYSLNNKYVTTLVLPGTPIFGIMFGISYAIETLVYIFLPNISSSVALLNGMSMMLRGS